MKNVVIVGAGRVGLANALWFKYKTERMNIYVLDTDNFLIDELKLDKNPYGPSLDKVFRNQGNEIHFVTYEDLPPGLLRPYFIYCIGSVKHEASDLAAVINHNYLQYPDTQAIIVRGTLSDSQAIGLLHDVSTIAEKVVAFPEFLVEGFESEGCVNLQERRNFMAPFLYFGSPENETINQAIHLYGIPRHLVKIYDSALTVFSAKLWTNVFLAAKVTLANLVSDFVDQKNYHEILEMIGSDKRIGSAFLRPGVGYGGSCLPFAVKKSTYSHILKSIDEYNESLPFLRRAQINKGPVLFFGFNFKGNGVKDTRNSNQLKMIELTAEKAPIYVTDNEIGEEPIVVDNWVENPFSLLENKAVKTVVIFYQTHWLSTIERHPRLFEGLEILDFR